MQENPEPQGERGSFETTHWSVILAAENEEHSTQEGAALGRRGIAWKKLTKQRDVQLYAG